MSDSTERSGQSSTPSEETGSESIGGVHKDVLEKLVEAQFEDARVRERELELRERELELNRQQAEASIEAQVEDRENQRDYFDRIHQRKQRYGIGLILLVLVFLGFLVYIDEQEIALELVKLALYGGGGYYAGKAVGENTSDDAEAQ